MIGRLLAVVAVTWVMTWPFVNYSDFASATYGGDQRLIVWTLAWDNHAVLTADRLFQSNLFFPASDSLRYNEHLFGISLFTLPLTLAGASPVLAHNLVWWLAWVLNGLASYALLRRFVQSGIGAFIGSVAFTYSFYVMLHAHGHLHQFWLWPIPLSLLLLERWFDQPSGVRIALWTAVVLLQAISSWYLAVFTFVANAVFGMLLTALALRDRSGTAAWPLRLRHLAAAAVVLALGIYPFARYYGGIASTESEIAAFSADIAAYLVPPENTFAGRWWEASIGSEPGPIFGERTLFAGWLTLVLAAAGLVVLLRDRRIDRRAWLFPLLVATGVLLSFGPGLPIVGATALAPFNWLTMLPGLAGVRVPARFAVLATLGYAGLVAIAATALNRRGGVSRLAVAAALPVLLLESFVVDFPAGKPQRLAIPDIYMTPEVRTARSIVSLPEYHGRDDWFLGGDYLYFSTAHWRPIVNGFGRTEPAGHAGVVSTVRRFPESIPEIRRLGIQYVVIHEDRFPEEARRMIDAANGRTDCRLVRRMGSDYLFEIR